MDYSKDVPVWGAASPLSLHEFLDAESPSLGDALLSTASSYSGEHDDVATGEAAGSRSPSEAPSQVPSRASGDGIQASARPPSPREVPRDWLASRIQVTPKKGGHKAEWIEGWYLAVSELGSEVYCACSESPALAPRSARAQTSSKNKGWREKGKTPATDDDRAAEARNNQLCPACMRPFWIPAPPTEPQPPEQKISRKISRFVMRVMRRGDDSRNSEAGELSRATSGSDVSPALAKQTSAKVLSSPETPGSPVTMPRYMRMARPSLLETKRLTGNDTSDEEEVDLEALSHSSDAARGRPALLNKQERLLRAQMLLERGNKSAGSSPLATSPLVRGPITAPS